MRRLILALALASAPVAHAEPPPGPIDPDTAAWFRSQYQPGSHLWCCDIADGRNVETRTRAGRYEAFISRAAFGANGDDQWHEVPDKAIIRGVSNPTGLPVVWWYGGEVRCFVEGSGS